MKMKTQGERMIDSLRFEIAQREKAIAAIERLPINLFVQCFPDGKWNNSWGDRFEFTLPFDFQLIAQVKQFVAEQFPQYNLAYERQYVWDERKEAGYFLEYETSEDRWGDRSTFEVGFRTGEKGTTCVLHPVGEKTIPVFEVVCSEGASEPILQKAQVS